MRLLSLFGRLKLSNVSFLFLFDNANCNCNCNLIVKSCLVRATKEETFQFWTEFL